MKVLLSGYHNPNFLNSMVYRDKAVGYLGHELISFDDRHFVIPGTIRSRFSALHQWDLQRLNRQLLHLIDAKRPDICLIIGGQRILPQTVAAVKKKGVPIALWTTDVPIDFKNILDAAPSYDHLFCAGTEASDIFHEHGLQNVTWVPFGCAPHFHKRIPVSEEDQKRYGRDIVFIGSYYPNRARLLEAIADQDLGVWGPYWEQLPPDSPLKPKAMDVKMNYDQWVKIYNASKIIIVIHYQNSKVPCHQASPKLFEAMACGSFVLTDRQKDVANLFKDKEQVVFFDHEQDLRQKIQYYLDHDEERQRIARNGHEAAVSHHRYQDRIQQMLDIVQKQGGV